MTDVLRTGALGVVQGRMESLLSLVAIALLTLLLAP